MIKSIIRFCMALVVMIMSIVSFTYICFHKHEAPKKTVEYVWGGCR